MESDLGIPVCGHHFRQCVLGSYGASREAADWVIIANGESAGLVSLGEVSGSTVKVNGKCGLYSEVTLEPGCSLGYHEHHNESETYYILSGKGIYSDNGTLRMVKAGDVTFTPDGQGHGMTNTGDEDLVFMALIILD